MPLSNEMAACRAATLLNSFSELSNWVERRLEPAMQKRNQANLHQLPGRDRAKCFIGV